jgi:hypothetical protein
MTNKERLLIKNKTYQPIQLIKNSGTHIINSRGNNDSLVVTELTTQMKNLIKKGLISVKPIR